MTGFLLASVVRSAYILYVVAGMAALSVLVLIESMS